jgi:hypothetical protein
MFTDEQASGINGKRDKYSVLKKWVGNSEGATRVKHVVSWFRPACTPNSTAVYVQKLKLLLNKTQSQLQTLLQKRRQAQQQAAASGTNGEANANANGSSAQQLTLADAGTDKCM